MGEFRPRQRLVELELAERYGVTRGRIRDALRQLAAKGLVALSPGRGAVVADYSAAEICDLYQVRQILELAAIELAAARVTPADIRSLRQLTARFAKAVGRRDFALLRAANDEFHRCIHRVSGNAMLSRLIDQLWLQSHLVRHFAWLDPERLRTSAQEHDAIVTALEHGQVDRVRQLYQKHMIGGRDVYLRLVNGLTDTPGSSTPRARER